MMSCLLNSFVHISLENLNLYQINVNTVCVQTFEGRVFMGNLSSTKIKQSQYIWSSRVDIKIENETAKILDFVIRSSAKIESLEIFYTCDIVCYMHMMLRVWNVLTYMYK